MVSVINLKTKEHNLASSGLKKEAIQSKISQSSQVVSDNFESNSAVKTISSVSGGDSITKLLPLVAGLYVVNNVADKALGGNPDKNILGKVAKLGDKISDVLHLEQFISKSQINGLRNKLQTNRFTKYFTEPFKANPICSFAKPNSIAKTMQSKLEDSASKLIPNIANLRYGYYDELKNLGSLSAQTIQLLDDVAPLSKRLTPEFLKSVTSTLDEIAKVSGSDVSGLKNRISSFLSNSGSISEASLSSEIASFLKGFKGKPFNLSQNASKVLSSVSGKTVTPEQIINAVDDLAKNGVRIDNGKFSIIRNKAAAANSQIGKTTLGKLFSKGIVKTKDVVTYGGDLLSLFFLASAIKNTVKATKEAPKGEKKATFAHVLSEQYIGMILFQPSMSILYKFGGNKYRGMTQEGRAALANLIKNTNASETITKEGIKIAKLQQKLLLKGVDKDRVAQLAGKGLQEAKNLAKSMKNEGAKIKLWERPLRFLGRLVSTGLDTIKSKPIKRVKLPFIKTKIKLPRPTFKGFVGGAMRFGLILMVIQPFIQKPLTKLVHKIFGEPKTYLEKQNASSQKNPQNSSNVENVVPGETNLLNILDNKNQGASSVANQSNTRIAQFPHTANAQAQGLIQNFPKNQSQQLRTQTQRNDSINTTNNILSSTQQSSQKQRYIPSIIPEKDNEGESAIGAFNLSSKKEQGQRYIPSIKPEKNDGVEQEKFLEKHVAEILKSTDKIIASSNKALS